jgi:hypothetical protein
MDALKIMQLIAAILWTAALFLRILQFLWFHKIGPVEGWLYMLCLFVLFMYAWQIYLGVG